MIVWVGLGHVASLAESDSFVRAWPSCVARQCCSGPGAYNLDNNTSGVDQDSGILCVPGCTIHSGRLPRVAGSCGDAARCRYSAAAVVVAAVDQPTLVSHLKACFHTNDVTITLK